MDCRRSVAQRSAESKQVAAARCLPAGSGLRQALSDTRERLYDLPRGNPRSPSSSESTAETSSELRRVKKRRSESGETTAQQRSSKPPQWLPYTEALQEFMASRPDATLAEVKEPSPIASS